MDQAIKPDDVQSEPPEVVEASKSNSLAFDQTAPQTFQNGAVRVASMDDLRLISDLTEEFLSTRAQHVPFDREFNQLILKTMFENNNCVVLLLADGDGVLVGMHDHNIYNRWLVAKEVMWFARETSRTGGLRLLRAFEQWAENKNCVGVVCALPEEHRAMERFGYEKFENQYTKYFENREAKL